MKDYSKSEISKSKNDYDSFCGNRVQNNKIATVGAECIVGDYKRTSMKRGIYEKTQFSVNAERCALTDSRFNEVLFTNFKLCRTNLQFCFFNLCAFKQKERINFYNNNFDSSTFNQCEFYNVDFISCGMSSIQFIKCTFYNCNIESSTLESTLFKKCEFHNCDFSNINIEYSTFNNCQYQKLILPVSQAPYIFGFNKFSNLSKIYFCNDRNIFSFNEYKNRLSDFIPYYYDEKQYFVLANIAMLNDNFEEAYDNIITGIKYYKLTYDTKMIKHLCKLATIEHFFTNEQMMSMFNLIKDVEGEMFKENELIRNNYNQCIYETKNILLEAKYSLSKACVYINTNIENYSNENLTKILNDIDKTLLENNVYSKKIEIRHNSPFDLLVEFVQNPEVICCIINHVIDIISLTASIITITDATSKAVKKVGKKANKNSENPVVYITIYIEN